MCMTKPESTLRQIVRQGYAAGVPVADIAVRAGTTIGVVHVTAWRMGIKHPAGRGRPRKT